MSGRIARHRRGSKKAAEPQMLEANVRKPIIDAEFQDHEVGAVGLPNVTLVQYRILEYLAKGWASKQIAGALGVSESSVNHQKEKLRDKFNVTNSPALVFATWEYLRKVKAPVEDSSSRKRSK
jgi:DNA-binding CsgD family transcriptional regulator